MLFRLRSISGIMVNSFMVNFTISESSNYHEFLDEFVKLYNDGVIAKDICEQLNLSKSNYKSYFKRAVEEGLITKRYHNRKMGKKNRARWKPKNYTHIERDYYRISKRNKYVTSICGEERAKLFVELMNECDWDLNRIQEIKRRVYNAKPTRRRIKGLKES